MMHEPNYEAREMFEEESWVGDSSEDIKLRKRSCAKNGSTGMHGGHVVQVG